MKSLVIGFCILLLSGCYCIQNHRGSGPYKAGCYSGTCFCSACLVEPFAYWGEDDWATAYCKLMWLSHLVDLPLEVVADTVTFPYDLCVSGKEK